MNKFNLLSALRSSVCFAPADEGTSGGAPASEGKGAMFAKQFNAQYAQTTTKE